MTPVRLRLHNFLSYGAEAPELDFEQFDVACLSGGNGQGKSALLDAITWALWGEARKPAGAGKPDEELLHTGTNRMEVDFEFAQEGTRYRVVRTFSRSSSGRTTRPGLDFSVLDAPAGQWNALTSDAIRSTQEAIDRVVGIDYDTFVNSALLLQGRSDEFTRRRPAERKEVLGRILGLDRYARLATAASERHSAARETVRASEQQATRLRDALQHEGAWRAEHAAAETEVARSRELQNALVSEEAALASSLAGLEEKERDAGRREKELRKLEERGLQIATQLDSARTRFEAARSVLERRVEIEAAAARHQELTTEVDRLENLRERHTGLTFEVRELQREAAAVEASLHDRLTRLCAEEQSARDRLAEEEALAAERPAVLRQLRAAKAADERVREMTDRRLRRDELLQRRVELQSAVDKAGSDLQRELVRAELELEELEAVPSQLAELTVRSEELAVEVERIRKLHLSRDDVRAAGTEGRLRRDNVLAEVARLSTEMGAVQARRDKMSRTADGYCPTCGTPLTDEHRATMLNEYTLEIEGLGTEIASRESEAMALRESCEKLAARFRSLEQSIAQANGAAGHHAHAVAEIARLEGLLACIPERRRRVSTIRGRIQSARFAAVERKAVEALDAEIAALGFDSDALDAARREAGRAEPLSQRLADIDLAISRRDLAVARSVEIRNEIAFVNEDLATGRTMYPLRERLRALTADVEELGFDAGQEARVRQELEALGEAVSALGGLARAAEDFEVTRAQIEALAADGESCHAAIIETRTALAALAEALSGRATLAEALNDVSARRKAADVHVVRASNLLGGLAEKLARCDLDRALLRDEVETLKNARRDAAVSRHLRQAFGPHGIPSLIIEETLPEIETRANSLLERLSGDGTRVALETVKETRSGAAKDTLEIRITGDTGATRPYETYSGGEAFRVNFALRIALAQLLADRAGVRLRTLVVDEGFGTQDAEGRQSLVEAIGVVQADFDKVLVISHLDDIKDAFPVRIEVSKTPLAGSTFTVVGVG